jgi:hypothetical protein
MAVELAARQEFQPPEVRIASNTTWVLTQIVVTRHT